ncbi:hypothetical protein FB567DRAFT_51090 [Paraphoma chrysanthemicola]|uniref:CorA-like transporter domain-containing protein n=1 Tax=Paraphoma chrysanthemicola TaxID=798071 RepID=A0A8K0R6F2_9PLEO|nr:hypothetical protein FB567DRAFT_51090 [Paraphoma chrysanthemicola]
MDHLILQIYSQAAASHVDIITRQKLLVENLDRIFADRGDVETWEYHGKSNSLKEFVITSVADFNRMCMEAHSLGGRSFFITQVHSWSRLQVTARLLLHIVYCHQITPLMLDFLHCFGAKVTGEDNPYYGTFYARFSGPAGATGVPTNPHYGMLRYPSRYFVGPSFIYVDFCCHLRRFEKHGNSKLKDPWSLRQMTACQRFDIVNQTSTWIFIKPMEHFQKNFRVLLSGDQRNNPMAPHLLCLTMASENWRWYVDFLRRRLGEFVEKATFASFNASKLNYDISLVDSQRLSTLESKVTVAIAVLEQNLAIGRGMQRHCQRLWRIKGLNIDHGLQETTESDIEMQLTHLDLHKTSCELLLQRIQGTCSMVHSSCCINCLS